MPLLLHFCHHFCEFHLQTLVSGLHFGWLLLLLNRFFKLHLNHLQGQLICKSLISLDVLDALIYMLDRVRTQVLHAVHLSTNLIKSEKSIRAARVNLSLKFESAFFDLIQRWPIDILYYPISRQLLRD